MYFSNFTLEKCSLTDDEETDTAPNNYTLTTMFKCCKYIYT